MTTPFQVDPDQIRGHAKTVGNIAGELSSTAGGMSGGLTDNALGSFVQFLTSGLMSAAEGTRGAISNVASTMDGVSTQLGQLADRYQNTDGSNANSLTSDATGLNGVQP